MEKLQAILLMKIVNAYAPLDTKVKTAKLNNPAQMDPTVSLVSTVDLQPAT
jgi:hypothetical protein